MKCRKVQDGLNVDGCTCVGGFAEFERVNVCVADALESVMGGVMDGVMEKSGLGKGT